MLFEFILKRLGQKQDLTARERAVPPEKQQNPPSADVLGAVLDHISQGVAVFDADLRLVVCNLRYADIFGYPARLVRAGTFFEEFVRHNLSVGAFKYDDGQDVETVVRQRVALARESVPRRLERVLEDGRVIAIRRSPLPEGGFIATYTDITDRKRFQDKADGYVRMLSDAIAYLPEGIRIFDSEMKLVACNSRALEMFDFPPELGEPGTTYETHLAHTSNRETADETGAISLSERLARAVHNKEDVREVEYDGRFIIKRRNALPAGGFVTTYNDVTEIRRAQLLLAEEFKRAELANRSKSEFLANMSHELRTPLNAIIGFSEIMSEQLFGPIGNERYVEYVKDTLESSRHLLGIINDILDLSKIEAGRTQLQEGSIDIGSLVKSCMRLMAQSPIRGDVALNEEIPQGLPLIRGDERMLKQLLLNLVSNAVKFTPDGGAVTVTARAEEKGLTLTVADNGIGIAEEDIAKAMTPFHQIDNTIARKYEGTGLGLPLAASFAKMHGGDLKLTSTLGVGTNVTIYLPAERLIPRTADAA